MKRNLNLIFLTAFTAALLTGCKEEEDGMPQAMNPDTAPKASIDRFSEGAGTLFVRDGDNLPGPNEPINFDQGPFITQGFGPGGEVARYYNFDVQPITAAPIFALFREGESDPVPGQLNIINVIPGDAGYNDFWHVQKVTVPENYVVNTVTSAEEIMENGYEIEPTNMLVNCPVVPEGSTASLRFNPGESPDLVRGWYKDQVVFYFNFTEKELTVTPPAQGSPEVPVSGIRVTFNINPDEEGGGPPSGFVTEGETAQTHNVVQTLPSSPSYSPLWNVHIYDNADFNMVFDWASSSNATILAENAALVNCPIVSVEEGNLPLDPNSAPETTIDRFSEDAGTLFIRDETNGFPEAGEPIDFDQGPFITQGLGPNGEVVRYYNFDVQPVESAPIYALFKEGSDEPVPEQLNIVGVVPGVEGYNDFWHVIKVVVPDYYRANTVTSETELLETGYSMEGTGMIVNCPIVPDGSTAELRYLDSESNQLVRGWHNDEVIYYFNFSEKQIMADVPDEGQPNVPLSGILVTFNINPGEEGGGPPSGFVMEPDSDQTHNVVQTLPEDEGYSPLWHVDIYDNADFDQVSDWTSAMNAGLLASGAAIVNCPIVDVD